MGASRAGAGRRLVPERSGFWINGADGAFERKGQTQIGVAVHHRRPQRLWSGCGVQCTLPLAEWVLQNRAQVAMAVPSIASGL